MHPPLRSRYWQIQGCFFFFSGVIGYLVYQVFERMSLRHPRTKRLTVLGLAFCFLMSYLAEEFFGIADITGAYVAGLVLSNLRDSHDIERRLDVNSYTLFGPLFFASVGISTDISAFDTSILAFSGVPGGGACSPKIVGCGLDGLDLPFQEGGRPEDRRGDDEPGRGSSHRLSKGLAVA